MPRNATTQKNASRTAIAALTFDIAAADAAVQLLPAGEFRAKDGRPTECAAWRLTEANAPMVLARARTRVNRFFFDYEHQTQQAEKNGQPAPAAGWFDALALEFRPGEGLFATQVEWTPRATEFIRNKEYRYVSAVFGYDKVTGDVQFLVCAALTNDPALDGLDDVSLAALSARFQADTAPAPSSGGTSEHDPMNPVLKALLAALGLTESATEQEAVAALTAIKTSAASVAGLNTEIATLKAATPDPARFVSIDKFTQLNTELVQLKATTVDREVEDLISQAKLAGKVTPAAEDVWRAVGKASIAQLKKLVDTTPGNPALGGKSQTQGEDPAGGDGKTLNETELAVCKAVGLTAEQYQGGSTATA